MKKLVILFILFRLAVEIGQAAPFIISYIKGSGDNRQTGANECLSSLSAAGIDSSKIAELTRLIEQDSFGKVHSLLIMKDKKLVYENYFGRCNAGVTQMKCWQDKKNQLHDCRSISRSVVASCIGIAIKKGIITSIDDPVKKYVPGITDTVKGTITIRQLLTMTSGLRWKELGSYGSFFNDETQMDLSFHPVSYVIKKPLESVPGMKWNYSAGNTQLLAEIVHRASGLQIDEFAHRYLFTPLDINEYAWRKLTFKHVPAAASGLQLTSRDLLKFGQLYLDKGYRHGQQVLDTSWVLQSITSQVIRPDLKKYKIEDGGYGFSFWTYRVSIKNKTVDIAEAKGNGGQSVFLCPLLNLVVVTTGGNYNKANNGPYLMLTKYILPSVMKG